MDSILVDDEKCLACNSCQIACCIAHSESKTLYGAISEKAPPASKIHVEPGVKGIGFPLNCRHCQDPQCVKACVTKSLYMAGDGAVLHDDKRCIGCLMCFIACPFGAIEEGVKKQGGCSVSKCDLCISLDSKPACVDACPTKALVFAKADSFSKDRRRKYIVEMAASPEAASNQ
ncbi:MAG: 4Fe-4S dicluster domain-containing protein [Treponema sp.]|nr:4Fe-4S dicluster domain-containing protein [Treponema sp.]